VGRGLDHRDQVTAQGAAGATLDFDLNPIAGQGAIDIDRPTIRPVDAVAFGA
jgi:hypothetical protein